MRKTSQGQRNVTTVWKESGTFLHLLWEAYEHGPFLDEYSNLSFFKGCTPFGGRRLGKRTGSAVFCKPCQHVWNAKACGTSLVPLKILRLQQVELVKLDLRHGMHAATPNPHFNAFADRQKGGAQYL
jgi:hypothetical protein